MHVYALLVWNPAMGLSNQPVGALGIDGPVWLVEWVHPDHTADPWRDELYAHDPPSRVEDWLRADGTRQLKTIPLPLPESCSLRDQVAATAELLLVPTRRPES